MLILVDESGNFTPTFGFSAVCSLAIPHRSASVARREIETASKPWSRVRGELKSGSLNPDQLRKLVDILVKRQAILTCYAMDVSCEKKDEIAAHQAKQCEFLTESLTPEHQASLVEAVWKLRNVLEAMPNQLYLQSLVMTLLICTTIQDVASYFSQRLPRELGRFEWRIDAKDPKRITTQEEWWRDTLGPFIETRSRENPFMVADARGFDYRYFKRRLGMNKELWHPDKPSMSVDGFDIGRIIIRNMTFVDSREDSLVQAIDILTGFVRRALAGQVKEDEAIRQLGRLQILQRQKGTLQSVNLISLSQHKLSKPGLRKTLKLMDSSAQSMWAT
jgi:hypothetical protein